MKKRCILFVVLIQLFSYQAANACGNEYYTLYQIPLRNDSLDLGSLLTNSQDLQLPYWQHGFGENIAQMHRTLLDSIHFFMGKKSPGSEFNPDVSFIKKHYRLLSDFAWHELRVGKKKNAVELLEKLYATLPEEYNVVANLGTAYEVTGNNAKALELLKKAVAINPGSHEGSEWIHIKILEQKLAPEPDYTLITGLRVGSFKEWISDRKYAFPKDPETLKKQLAFQLHERISFIPAPDPVIAQLVLDFADIVAKQDGAKAADPFYNFALQYNKKGMQETIAARKAALALTIQEVKTSFRWASLIWGLPLIVFALIFIAWIRSGRRQSTRE